MRRGCATYRVLLVDDEPWTLKSLLLTVDWAANGFEVCAALTSAREALDQIPALLPDVMFADIRMPHMDGLELLGAVRARWPHIHTIILSGYADFAYAQEAITLGVLGYCLKPIDEDEVAEVLARAREAIDTQGRRYAELLDRDRPIPGDPEWPQLLAMHGVKALPLDAMAAPRDAPHLEMPALRIQREGESVFFYERALRNQALNALAGRPGSIGIAEISSLEATALRVGGERAHIARQKSFLGFEPGAFIYSEVPLWPIEEAARAFMRHCASGNAHLAAEALERIRVLLTSGAYHVDHALIAFNWLCDGLPLERARTADALVERYAGLSGMLAAVRSTLAAEDPNQSEFWEMADYVQAHLNIPDLFQGVGQAFHRSASHLSRLFRRCSGKTFTQYVQSLRMDRAKTLLQETNLSVREIGVQCGYSDYFYFARQFKRAQGVTPSEWRQMGREHSE